MMIYFDFPTNLPRKQIKTIDGLASTMNGMSANDWLTESGTAGLVSERTGSYITLVRHPHEPLYMLASAREPGTDEMVYVQSQIYSDPVSVYIGGEEINYPIQFFHSYDQAVDIFDEFIKYESINYNQDWRVLHIQEWDGMMEY